MPIGIDAIAILKNKFLFLVNSKTSFLKKNITAIKDPEWALTLKINSIS